MKAQNKQSTYLLMVILVLLAASCSPAGPEILDGQTLLLQQGTTRFVVEHFIEGGTAFFNPANDVVIFARPLANNVAWVAVKHGQALKDLQGNLNNIKDWNDLVWCLGENGYEVVIGTGAVYYEQVLKAAAAFSKFELIPIFMLVPTGGPNFAEQILFGDTDDA